LPVEFVFIDHAPEGRCRTIIDDCLPGRVPTYLPDPANPGFAAGCNRGAAAAKGTHILLLNPDVWLHDDSLHRILAAIADHPEHPLAVGMSMGRRAYLGIDVHPISLFIDRQAHVGRGPLGPSGGAAVFPVAVFDRLSGFYEHLFAWGEDADLAYRLFAAGIRTYAIDLILIHEKGHSVDGDAGLGRFRAFLLARNRILVGARCLSWPMLLLGFPLAVLAHCGLAMRRARQGQLRAFAAGVLRGLLEARTARRMWLGNRFGVRTLVRYVTWRD
jgi:GT2 family glycosyltransferase